jgi:hypothetical protein
LLTNDIEGAWPFDDKNWDVAEALYVKAEPIVLIQWQTTTK